MAWAYKVVVFPQFGAVSAEFESALDQLGSVGWELVGISTTSNVHGNQMPHSVAVLKRPRPDLPAPGNAEGSGWRSDPTQRYLHRWWDGVRWTESVYDGSNHSVDFPLPSV